GIITSTAVEGSIATVTQQATEGVSNAQNVKNILITIAVTTVLGIAGAGVQQWRLRNLDKVRKRQGNIINDQQRELENCRIAYQQQFVGNAKAPLPLYQPIPIVQNSITGGNTPLVTNPFSNLYAISQ
ncbi:11279_t:CDS:1, partial [Acaulospora morrowiae]